MEYYCLRNQLARIKQMQELGYKFSPTIRSEVCLYETGYVLWGVKDNWGEAEEIVYVEDYRNMDRAFLMYLILGPLGYFLEVPEGDISRFLIYY